MVGGGGGAGTLVDHRVRQAETSVTDITGKEKVCPAHHYCSERDLHRLYCIHMKGRVWVWVWGGGCWGWRGG